MENMEDEVVEEVPSKVIPLPAPTVEMLKMVNLPSDMGNNAIWGLHEAHVLGLCRRYLTEESWDEAQEELDADDAMIAIYRLGYSLLMLASTCELLNLKTIGEGIVKTIGLDNSATELLTGGEIEEFRRRVERKALEVWEDILSVQGKIYLDELRYHRSAKLRIGVI